MKSFLLASAATLALSIPISASAQSTDNLEKLSNFQSTGASMQMETVEQGGQKAEQIKQNLQQVKLPQGFKIELFAIVPDARHMAVGPQGIATFVGTQG